MTGSIDSKTGLLAEAIRYGVLVGILVAGAVSLVIMPWELWENPGGVFRGASGVNWNNVLETLVSWFVPTFCYAAIVGAVARLAWILIGRMRAGR